MRADSLHASCEFVVRQSRGLYGAPETALSRPRANQTRRMSPARRDDADRLICFSACENVATGG
eukprot:3573541-Rhodomonas_salina.1